MDFVRSWLWLGGGGSSGGSASAAAATSKGTTHPNATGMVDDDDDDPESAMMEPSDSIASLPYIRTRCRRIEQWWRDTMGREPDADASSLQMAVSTSVQKTPLNARTNKDRVIAAAAAAATAPADAPSSLTFGRECVHSNAAVLIYHAGEISMSALEDALGQDAPRCIRAIVFHMPDQIDNDENAESFIKVQFDPFPPADGGTAEHEDEVNLDDAIVGTTNATASPFQQGRLVRRSVDEWIYHTPLDNERIRVTALNILDGEDPSPVQRNLFELIAQPLPVSGVVPAGNTQLASLLCKELANIHGAFAPLHLTLTAVLHHDPRTPHLSRVHVTAQRLPSVSLEHLRGLVLRRPASVEDILVNLATRTITCILFPVELVSISAYQWINAEHAMQMAIYGSTANAIKRNNGKNGGPIARVRMFGGGGGASSGGTAASVPYESTAPHRRAEADRQKMAAQIAAAAATVARERAQPSHTLPPFGSASSSSISSVSSLSSPSSLPPRGSGLKSLEPWKTILPTAITSLPRVHPLEFAASRPVSMRAPTTKSSTPVQPTNAWDPSLQKLSSSNRGKRDSRAVAHRNHQFGAPISHAFRR